MWLMFKHSLAREAMQYFNISALEIVSIADIPAGTGLVSSSSYLVGLLNACTRSCRQALNRSWRRSLSHRTRYLKKAHWQADQYMAAFAADRLDIAQDGKVKVRAQFEHGSRRGPGTNIILFYTHDIRDARPFCRSRMRQRAATIRLLWQPARN